MTVLALLFLAVGMMFVAAGIQLGPHDHVAADAFRSDRSCAASLSADAPHGACSVVTAQVLVAAMRTGSFARTRSKTAYVVLRLADGTTQTADLDGSAGRDFVETVHSGAPARAQLFRGTLVRVVSGKSSAETEAAPDISASDDSQMPWVGAVLIAVAVAFAVAAIRSARRVRTAD